MPRLAFTTAAIVLTALTTTAHADDPPAWRIEMGSSTRWLGDTSAAAVTTDTLGLFVLSGERRFATLALPRGLVVELAGTGALATGGAGGTMFQTLSTNLDTLELLAGVHASARLVRMMVVSARAELGADKVSLRIAPTGQPAMTSVDDRGWGRAAAASIGAELDPIARPQLRLGVGAELGYTWTSAVEMHASPGDEGDPDLTIRTAFASIGRLDLDGWSLRVTAHVAF